MDPKINKILFTTDLSDNARTVFQYAVMLARSCGATITMLHVIEDIQPSTGSILKEELGEEEFTKLQEEKQASATTIMIGKQKEAPMIEHVLFKLSESAAAGSDGGSPVVVDKRLVTIGRIDEEILYQADANDCDLIVMANRLPGSTAEKPLAGTVGGVVRRSKRQVYLVPIAN